jgi:hypothetical protein
MSTNTGIATLADAVREAQQKFAARGETSNDFAKWLIIVAAIFGALLLTRFVRRIYGIAFALFWVWFWTHGAWRHIF